MSDQKKLSVVLPVHNAAPFLEQCFDSVLSQAGVEFELLVIDDGSTDGSREICARHAGLDSRIRLFRTENGGPGAAKNLALAYARGDAAAFIDADDYFEPDALKILHEAWLDTGADFIRCENRIFIDSSYPPPDAAGLSLSGPPQGKMPRDRLIDVIQVNGRPRVKYWSPCGSSLVSLATVRRHGIRFNEKMRLGEDSWFMLELAGIPVSYRYSGAVVYNWRRHGYNSLTLTALHPLERAACRFFFYAKLRDYLRARLGDREADRALAHNYASVAVEVLMLYGGWATRGKFHQASAGIAAAMTDPVLVRSIADFTPTRRLDKIAKIFVRLGWAKAMTLLGRHFGKGAVAGWDDLSGFNYRRVVDADYAPGDEMAGDDGISPARQEENSTDEIMSP